MLVGSARAAPKTPVQPSPTVALVDAE